jgi:hypothetical protein
MTSTIRTHFWDLAYALLLAAAVPAAIFHAVQGRWAQAVLATIAAGIGVYILVSGWNRREAPVRTRAESREYLPESQPSIRAPLPRSRDSSGRYENWLSSGVVSGFAATGIMTAAVLAAYALSYLIGSDAEGANQLRLWFAALVDNTVTEIARVNLAIAIFIHLAAGIGWAILYAGMVEPRLSGSGLQRGVKFALLPWALSVLVFFPVVGAGFLGLDLGASLLPVLGNLFLHLVYGGALGMVYESQSVWDESRAALSPENTRVLDSAQRTMAIGLIPGAIFGLFIGLIGSSVLAPDIDLLMSGVIGMLVGSAFGVWVGSLAGLTTAEDLNGANRQRT